MAAEVATVDGLRPRSGGLVVRVRSGGAAVQGPGRRRRDRRKAALRSQDAAPGATPARLLERSGARGPSDRAGTAGRGIEAERLLAVTDCLAAGRTQRGIAEGCLGRGGRGPRIGASRVDAVAGPALDRQGAGACGRRMARPRAGRAGPELTRGGAAAASRGRKRADGRTVAVCPQGARMRTRIAGIADPGNGMPRDEIKPGLAAFRSGPPPSSTRFLCMSGHKARTWQHCFWRRRREGAALTPGAALAFGPEPRVAWFAGATARAYESGEANQAILGGVEAAVQVSFKALPPCFRKGPRRVRRRASSFRPRSARRPPA